MLKKISHYFPRLNFSRWGGISAKALTSNQHSESDNALKMLQKNWRTATPEKLEVLRDCLIKNYFTNCDLSSEAIKNDIANHLEKRLESHRNELIPWLHQSLSLKGARILEIGCGTGCSTLALAEQGAEVTGIDVVENNLLVAEERCRTFGVSARFELCNANKIEYMFGDENFDLIIFFASLEHMNYKERFDSISQSWKMLQKGKFWCVIETPNRLWHFDHHSAQLPFFHWLPDDVAFDYANRFSPRDFFQAGYLNDFESEVQRENFFRFGRSISYHEIELATGILCKDLELVSSLNRILSEADLAFIDSLFNAYGEQIHRAFLFPSLDFIISKN